MQNFASSLRRGDWGATRTRMRVELTGEAIADCFERGLGHGVQRGS
jgi:hypothetical protein